MHQFDGHRHGMRWRLNPLMLVQLLLGAKSKLESIVAQKLEEAVAARDHANVLRFIKLHEPLGTPDKGLAKYIDYLRLSVGGRARDNYNVLSEALDAAPVKGNKKAAAADFIGTLTELFKALAVAVETDEKVTDQLTACLGC